MNLKISLITFFTFCLSASYSSAQTTNVSGIVIDGDTHQPIINALVKVIDSDIITYTNSDGVFSFKQPQNSEIVLQIKNIGYRDYLKKITPVKNSEKLLIHLYPLPVNAPSVVVHGDFSHQTSKAVGENDIVLEGLELQRNLGLSLASTLKNEVGIGLRSMGPATTRPVIRGLSGERIMILQDNNNTNDLSATSPDHAVTIEPSTMDLIEVIRGPRVLTKSGNAAGGVINVISNGIPQELPSKITGNFTLFGESANKGYSGSGAIAAPLGSFAAKIDFSKRNAGDLKTADGLLPNSSINNYGFSAGFSYLNTQKSAGLSMREFSSTYGVPGGFIGAHPKGIDINMFRRTLNGIFDYRIEHRFFDEIHFSASRTYYKHTEKEKSGLIGAEFASETYDFESSIKNNNFTLFSGGETGISLSRRKLDIGGYVFTPNSVSLSFSAFTYQTINRDNFEIQASLRFNQSVITPENEFTAKIGNVRKRKFNNLSFSLSSIFKLSEKLHIGGNVNRSSRVPSIEELFSEGPHLAAYSYETGNPDLESEKGYGAELFFNYKSNLISSNITFFINDYSYFITPRNSGKINWGTLLPIYSTEGINAILTGIEQQLDIKLCNELLLNQSLSYTFGKVKNGGDFLPMIPPLKLLIGIEYKNKNFSAGVNSESTSKQSKVDKFEEKTPGYLIFNCFAQFTALSGEVGHNISLNIDNIFDVSYRNHLSRIKTILPEPGINIRLTYKLFY